MKTLLKNGRELKGLKTREVANILHIDQALISKFENGQRVPTKKQLLELSKLLEINFEILSIAWLKEKILRVIEGEEFGTKAIVEMERELNPQVVDSAVELLFLEMNALKEKMEALRKPQ